MKNEKRVPSYVDFALSTPNIPWKVETCPPYFKTSESCLRDPAEVSGDCRQCTAEKFNFTQTFTFSLIKLGTYIITNLPNFC